MRVYFSDTHFDYPKRINELRVAWYQNGKVCIARNYQKQQLQEQNYQIIKVNEIVKSLYQELRLSFKKELTIYSQRFKKQYPHLRKRGISSYGIFLIIIHRIIKRFSLKEYESEKCLKILREIVQYLNIKDAVHLKLLDKVYQFYQLTRSAIYHPIIEPKSSIIRYCCSSNINKTIQLQEVSTHLIL